MTIRCAPALPLLAVVSALAAPHPFELATASIPWCGNSDFHHGADAPIAATHADRLGVPTVGTLRVLFLRVQCVGDDAPPVPFADAGTVMEAVDRHFQTLSYGKLRFEWTVSPDLPLPLTRDEYAPLGTSRILDDARAVALQQGLDFEDFDLDLVRHHPIPGWAGGYGRLGQRGAWAQIDGPAILVHEFGHNLGLSHANYWTTTGPLHEPRVSPPFPSPLNVLPVTSEFDPASRIGHDSIIGLGRSDEYGDVFDLMGAGGEGGTAAQINAIYKRALLWLEPAHTAVVATSQTVRLRPFDAEALAPDAFNLIEIDRPTVRQGTEQRFHLQLRQELPASPSALPALLVHWSPTERSGIPSSLLLDMTPGTPWRQRDAALPQGRSFSDPLAGLTLTCLAVGSDDAGPWADVSIVLDPPPDNQPPTLVLTASAAQVDPGVVVDFTAAASDPDGDPLTYFWDFDDDSPSTPSAQVAKAWPEPGHYAVRCEVSDGQGGIVSRHVVITVGQPTHTVAVSGRVLDPQGQPVRGVRVHNGRIYRNPTGHTHRRTFTDSDGTYTLTGLAPGSYTNAAHHPDYRLLPVGWTPPVGVESASIGNLDFLAEPLPEIRVSLSEPATVEGTGPVTVRFERTGPTDVPLEVPFTLSGTATPDTDYDDLPTRSVVFPSGASVANLEVVTRLDGTEEGPETLTFTVRLPAQTTREGIEGQPPFTVYFPGWEPRPTAGGPVWFVTEPPWSIGAASSVTLAILDSAQAPLPVVGLQPAFHHAIETPHTPSHFDLTVHPPAPIPLVVFLEWSGTATPGLDYPALSDQVAVPPLTGSVRLVIDPIADDLVEGPETVRLRLLPGPAYTIGVGVGEIQIRDDPSIPVWLQLKPPSGPTAAWEVHLNGAPAVAYVLESSPDLTHWQPLRTNRLFANPLIFPVPAPASPTPAFFRARSQP